MLQSILCRRNVLPMTNILTIAVMLSWIFTNWNTGNKYLFLTRTDFILLQIVFSSQQTKMSFIFYKSSRASQSRVLGNEMYDMNLRQRRNRRLQEYNRHHAQSLDSFNCQGDLRAEETDNLQADLSIWHSVALILPQ